MCNIISNSEDETIAIGRIVASYLYKGMVIVLSGDLGAGKTLFVSGMLDYFGKREEVSSPTFTIVNEYDLNDSLKLFHFDVYRLESSDEFLAIGGDEFFYQGVSLIEWGERIADLLPKDCLTIKIEKYPEDINKRKFSFLKNNNVENSMFDKMLEGISNSNI